MIDHKKLREELMQKCVALQVKQEDLRIKGLELDAERMGIMSAVDALDRHIHKIPKTAILVEVDSKDPKGGY